MAQARHVRRRCGGIVENDEIPRRAVHLCSREFYNRSMSRLAVIILRSDRARDHGAARSTRSVAGQRLCLEARARRPRFCIRHRAPECGRACRDRSRRRGRRARGRPRARAFARRRCWPLIHNSFRHDCRSRRDERVLPRQPHAISRWRRQPAEVRVKRDCRALPRASRSRRISINKFVVISNTSTALAGSP